LISFGLSPLTYCFGGVLVWDAKTRQFKFKVAGLILLLKFLTCLVKGRVFKDRFSHFRDYLPGIALNQEQVIIPQSVSSKGKITGFTSYYDFAEEYCSYLL